MYDYRPYLEELRLLTHGRVISVPVNSTVVSRDLLPLTVVVVGHQEHVVDVPEEEEEEHIGRMKLAEAE